MNERGFLSVEALGEQSKPISGSAEAFFASSENLIFLVCFTGV